MPSGSPTMKSKECFVLTLAVFVANVQSQDCPCSVQSGVLTCAENTIENIPEDLKIEECTLDISGVWSANIQNQPLSHIKDNAFAAFTATLFELSLSFNQIESIEKNAFNGLTGLSGLFLKGNNLTKIEGILDPLINLDILDLRDNDFIESYTTNQWQFCNIADKKDLFHSNLNVYKNFETSSQTENYCATRKEFYLEGCLKVDGDLDCTKIDDFNDAACYLEDQTFNNIHFTYPADEFPVEPANYGRGESDRFIAEFNSQKGDDSHFQYMKEITLYETKFDLTKMKDYTSERTAQVTIKADTIYMSAPVEINYKLNLIGRAVSLAHPIKMNMTKEMFFDTSEIEAWAEKEEFYTVGKVVMNKKTFGLVTILKNVAEYSATDKTSVCQPKEVSVEETNMNIEDWYDTTLVNLHYVCARSVLESKLNRPLVDDISTFMLGFVYNRTVVNNQETFIAAQKYRRLLDLNSAGSKVHNVPTYSEDTISSLAGIMHDSMTDYKLNELAQEEQLYIASGRLQDMKTQFEVVQQQQQFYFEKEKAELEQIWAAEDTEWQFNFDHRNEIADNIGGALNDINGQMNDMQEQDLELARAEAEASLQHIQDVINKYKTQVERLLTLTQGSIDVQAKLVEDLQQQSHDMDIEFKKFEIAIEDWKHEQEAKAVWGIFKAVLSFGIGLATGEIDPTVIGDIIENIVEIEELLIELIEIIENCNAISEMIDGLDLEDFGDINLNLDTNFKDALQDAIDMKMKSGSFDEIERTATIKLDALNAATDYGIDGTDDVMMACVAVSDTGHQLVNEASNFADNVLMLSERNDELAVAKADKERAIAEIEHIEQMLKDLKAERDEFEARRNQTQADYENKLQEMEDEYKTMTAERREEYRKEITALYDNFQQGFNELGDRYTEQLYMLMTGIHQKFYGLKIHSMNQRAMVMGLFVDYCDADFYNSFVSCDERNIAPYMSDELDVLLEKLTALQWNTVTSPENLPNKPENFESALEVDSKAQDLGGVRTYVVDSLKNTSRVDINLKDLDIDDALYDDFWRVRIETLKMILYDADGYPLQSQGSTAGKEISIRISFPTLFTDRDQKGYPHSFLALSFSCHADYYTENEGWTFFNYSLSLEKVAVTNNIYS